MLINIIECVHEYLIDLLRHLHRIFLDMLHLRHDLLQLLLYHVLLLCQRNVLRYSLRASIRMRVLDPQYALIRRFNGVALCCGSGLLHVARDYALTAERLVELRVEEFVALLVLRALAERQGLLTSWYTHVALQDRRLVKVSVVVEAKVRFIIDAVKFGRSWLLGTWLVGQMSGLFSSDSKVGLTLLANWCERLNRVWDSDFG